MTKISKIKLLSKGMLGKVRGGDPTGCACCICSPGASATGAGNYTASISTPPPSAWDTYGGYSDKCLPKT